MKKKLKDLTIAEIFAICDKTEFGDCYGGSCRLGLLCARLHVDLCERAEQIKKIYESEVEV